MNELRWILLGFGVVLLLGVFLWGRRERGQVANLGEPEERFDRAASQVSATSSVAAVSSETSVEMSIASRWREDEWSSTVTDLPEIRLDAVDHYESLTSLTEETGDVTGEEPLLPPEDVLSDPYSNEPAAKELSRAVEAHSVQAASAPVRQVSATDDLSTAKVRSATQRKIVALRLSAPAGERYSGGRLRTALEHAGLAHGKYGIFHRLHGEASVFSVASMVEPGAFDLATMEETPFAGVTLFTLLPGPVAAGAAYDQMLACARGLELSLGGVLHDERGAILTPQRAATLRNEVLDFEHLLGHPVVPASS